MLINVHSPFLPFESNAQENKGCLPLGNHFCGISPSDPADLGLIELQHGTDYDWHRSVAHLIHGGVGILTRGIKKGFDETSRQTRFL
ncbi:MAG: hypothetical protein WCK47_12840 [bacterium]|nr:hypothetical protein [Candidatus Sumerlaeota bacterium]